MNEEDREWISHAIMDYERRRCVSKVLKFDYKDAVGKGNNYLSDIWRLTLKVVLNSGECEERSLIYKIIPRGESFKAPDVKESGFFIKEARAYSEALPQMEKLLRSVQPDAETLWAQMYGVKGNFEGFVMEDLRPFGYKMCERSEGLDFGHASVALEHLAIFHALGAVLIKRGDILASEFGEFIMLKDEVRLKQMADNMTSTLVRTIQEHWKGEWLEYVEDLQELKKTMVEKLKAIAPRDESKFYTLNHGDFWTTNMLFKYDSEGNPKNIKMVDYQMMHCNCPSFDLHFFFGNCLNAKFLVRRPELLEIYHKTLLRNLKLFDYTGEMPTFEEFMESYERTKLFACHIAFALKPFLSSKSVEDIIKEHMGVVDMKEVDFDKMFYYLVVYGTENIKLTIQSYLKEMKENGLL